MDNIAFIYERFISISVRGDFNINKECFQGIKICFNPNFWPHSFNFKKVIYKKKHKDKKFNPIDKKWEKALKWINKKLSDDKLLIQDKKNIFIKWVDDVNELWEEVRKSWKIKDHYVVKSRAWNTFVSFLRKYNESKSNIISNKDKFKIYKIKKTKNNLNYDSDYVLCINDLYENKNFIMLFCVKSDLNDLNIKLINNPTKSKSKINYLYLTLKSIQLRNKYHFINCEEIKYTNIFLNKRAK